MRLLDYLKKTNQPRMTLTKDQLNAVEYIDKWSKLNIFKDQDDAFCCLYGSAGTGKTTVVNDIIKRLRGPVCVSAPTHKAKEVISAITDLDGLTIHSLLGLRPNVDLADYDPNNPQYDTAAEERIVEYDYIIVDECSMVNKMLFKKLIETATGYKKRILFVGDEKQLPPVNEKLSQSFKVKHTVELKEIVRQGNTNPNQYLLQDAVSDADVNSSLISKRFKVVGETLSKNPINGKDEGFIITDSQEAFYGKLIELYSDTEAVNNMSYIKTLAYTNEAVESLNKFIKARINPSDDVIAVGDYLLGYTTCLDAAGKVIVQNSSDYFIYNIGWTTEMIAGISFKFYIVTVSKTGKTFRILHPDSYDDFQEKIEHYFDGGKDQRRWRPYYQFKEKFIVLKDFYHRTRTNYNGKYEKVMPKSVDLGYAMTVHKSQGSTYDNVAVIYSNFKKCFKDVERKKLTYVALSRTKLLNLVYI